MGETIKKFFEFYIPVTCCNLKCEYCYVSQLGWQQGKMPKFTHSPKEIGCALSKERIGGTAFICLCGGGETLLPPEMPEIVKELLAQGHYVNVTSNATVGRAFDEIIRIVPAQDLARLHFVFSLHYLELKRLNLLDRYVDNVHKVRAAGCSFEVKINLYDGYIMCVDEIKEFCLKNFQAFPQCAVTRKEGDDLKYHATCSDDEYVCIGKSFNSPTFDLHLKNFKVSRRGQFCYAGVWSYVGNLAEGWVKACYCNGRKIDLFKNIDKPIPEAPVGCNCKHCYCVNADLFLTLGTIPGVYDGITCESIRNRPLANWYGEAMREFLSTKLLTANRTYMESEKRMLAIKQKIEKCAARIVNGLTRRMLHRNLWVLDDPFSR